MTTFNRRTLLLTGGVLLAGAASATGYSLWGGMSEEEARPFYTEDGVALRGTDPVAYFTESEPTPGSAEFAADWNGATWHFASAENRDQFLADPEAYAPQFGGFCAWAVAEKGELYSTDPTAWKIVDDKLYLNFNAGIQKKWEKDIPGFIKAADNRWPDILAEAQAS
ncbi:MAG: YHS domain-containing (seleno)protein [Pseudomonadota bacterium]